MYKKLATLLLTAWCLVVLTSLGWNIKHTQGEHLHFLTDTARLIFNHITIVRDWNANHGGVYVPVTNSTPPNKYLEIDNRDIVVNDRLTLTMVNPAYMTRQIADVAEQSNGIQLHITSLDPIRPNNKPTSREREALLEFETKDSKEYSRLLADRDGYQFFYMAPLMTTRACLRCHEQQGFNEGDLRGGISVTIPNIHPAPIGGMIIEYRRATRNKIPLTLMICDIDYFKQFNDSFGHLEGDDCLVKVAKTIQKSLHRGDDLCARYGGEEFIVILPNTDRTGGEKVAKRIQQEIQSLAIAHPDSPIDEHLTLSIGLATDFMEYPSHCSLIKRADDALYRCKHQGRKRIEYQPPSAARLIAARIRI